MTATLIGIPPAVGALSGILSKRYQAPLLVLTASFLLYDQRK